MIRPRVAQMTLLVLLAAVTVTAIVPAAAAAAVDSAAIEHLRDPLQPLSEPFAGPTATGSAPFLAQTNPAPFSGVSYIPPLPLETQVPIDGARAGTDTNVFELMGQLSHYFPNPSGFGVDEYSLPAAANITKLFMLHRHGARYPTVSAGAKRFGEKIAANRDKFKATGALEFLNDWSDKMGVEILVPIGKQELFDSGTRHYYQYGHLYNSSSGKIVARSTTQHRMTESAEYFLAGFFGLDWVQNATLERIIEARHFNNSLAGYFACPNSMTPLSRQGDQAVSTWVSTYLTKATSRLQSMVSPAGFLDVRDVYNMQSLCAYETVAFGYSAFCGLFTHEEWQGYEYSVDLDFYGNSAFGSPTGRAVGIGWVAEMRARLKHHYITQATGQVNVTLDSNDKTFPLNQTLYFDFTHDTNIMNILTALGLRQFDQFLPATHMVPHDLLVSHMEPFAANLDIELIETPHALRPDPVQGYDVASASTTYIHFLLNQRTIPLHLSYKQCETRKDGWCELGAFLNATSDLLAESEFEFACFGDYEPVPYGPDGVTNGVPLAFPTWTSSSLSSSSSSSASMETRAGSTSPVEL